MLPPSSSLSGAAPRDAPGRSAPPPIPRRFARFSSRFARRISTCCSSRRRRSSSGLKALLALKVVRRCSGMYLSAIFAATVCRDGAVVRVCLEGWRRDTSSVCLQGIKWIFAWGKVKRRRRKRQSVGLSASAVGSLGAFVATTLLTWLGREHVTRRRRARCWSLTRLRCVCRAFLCLHCFTA